MPHEAPAATACRRFRRLNYADCLPGGETLASDWPAEPVRQGRTADHARVFLFDDGSLRIGRRVVARAGPMWRAMALFNVVDRFRADELPAAAAALDEVEARHEDVAGFPHDLLLEVTGKAAAPAARRTA